METQSIGARVGGAKIIGGHGYRIDGDVALLNADLAVLSPEASLEHWALQLWACDSPHTGGPLEGTKVAEATVDLSDAEPGAARHLQATAPACLPANGAGHAMVLVLASTGASEQVHDFANYPERQTFFVPHFAGAVGYAIEGDAAVLKVERVSNPRAADNLSGSLSLELRATKEGSPGEAREEIVLACVGIGRLSGGASLEGTEARVAFRALAEGDWTMALALLEWTAAGPAVRDRWAFELPYRSSPARPAPTPGPRLVSIQTGTLEELSLVKGLTRKLALEIVKARPFRSFDDLVRVRGIGEKTARKLRSLLTV